MSEIKNTFDYKDDSGKSVFLNADTNKLSRYVILCVDDPLVFRGNTPEKIAKFCDSMEIIGKTGLQETYAAVYKNTPITLCLTGTGSPETELALMELIMNSEKIDTIVRLGGGGAIGKDIKPGDIVISTGAVRDDGCSKEYVKSTFPALASYEVFLAQATAAKKLGFIFHLGITVSTDSMFPACSKPSYHGYFQKDQKDNIEYLFNTGAANIDRETSIILTLTTLFGLRGGSVCFNGPNLVTGEMIDMSIVRDRLEKTIKITLEGFRVLSEWDRKKAESGEKYYTPLL